MVWTLQRRVRRTINRIDLPLRVFHDFPIARGNRRATCADLAVLDDEDAVQVALEFKYEPDHTRGRSATADIWRKKIDPSVVFWGKEGVLKDVQRCQQFILERLCISALSVFIDEGGTSRHRDAH